MPRPYCPAYSSLPPSPSLVQLILSIRCASGCRHDTRLCTRFPRYDKQRDAVAGLVDTRDVIPAFRAAARWTSASRSRGLETVGQTTPELCSRICGRKEIYGEGLKERGKEGEFGERKGFMIGGSRIKMWTRVWEGVLDVGKGKVVYQVDWIRLWCE